MQILLRSPVARALQSCMAQLKSHVFPFSPTAMKVYPTYSFSVHGAGHRGQMGCALVCY